MNSLAIRDYLPIILGLIPSFAWLIFYLEEDPHPEPRRLVFQTFLAGAVSTVVVILAEIVFTRLSEPIGIHQHTPLSFFGLAMIEEFFKFYAAYFILSRNLRDFDEPVDAMVYMVIAALGFATVENVGAAIKDAHIVFETTSLRFIGATLLHTLSSGLIGFYWAKAIIKRSRGILIQGIFYGAALHMIFNYLIITFRPAVIPTAFLVILAVFVLYDFEKLKTYTIKK